MDTLSINLLNDFQHHFPLVSRPFSDLAQRLNSDTQSIIERIKILSDNGTISRIGPVFKPNTIGVSTLAAISVPPNELERYAQIINRFVEVNHNYEREHEINLWFVLTAATQLALDTAISKIEAQTKQPVLVLPMLKEYHIDLGFSLHHLNKSQSFSDRSILKKLKSPEPLKQQEIDDAKDLIAAIQNGLPLVERPYQALAGQLNCQESEVIEDLKKLIKNGAIKRFGVVVRHHEIGYRANAMVVWDIADEIVDPLGKAIGNEDCVTLCYRRPRVLPRWPYNLFCMIHGKNRDEVTACIEQLCVKHQLLDHPQQILFSGTRFKQRGARYQQPKVLQKVG